MQYEIASANEWLYPDSTVSPAGKREVALSAARGTRAACQILLRPVALEKPIIAAFTPDAKGAPEPELFQLVDVMVETNTGPISFAAKKGESAEGYTTRPAPFRVYDAMRPLNREARTRKEVEALYVSWRVPVDARPGRYTGALSLKMGSDSCTIPVALEVFPATVPDSGTFSLTNWFNLGIMARRHNLEMWSEAHWRMIRRYGEVMRRGRQTHFWVPMAYADIKETEPGQYSFGFEKVERLIRTYLGLGFISIEGGHVTGRRRYEAPGFVLSANSKINAVSTEGYAFLAQYLPAWRAFLQRNGWLKRTIQHVGDEPTEKSAHEFRIISGIVRKFMPGTPIIDAVSYSQLGGAVDIWVPTNAHYEEHREEFEINRRFGDTIWTYTCCFPGGRYMNRLLDMPLIRTRLLQWGCFKYDLPGFLHWGLNHYREGQDPFEQNCPDHGGGNNLPPGDTHIVYPGADGPWGSVRLEAQAAGIEDYELLRVIAEKDRTKADEIVASTVRGFKDADEDTVAFETTHRRLLEAASKK